MDRFDDDKRENETPHNPLARNRRSEDKKKVSVKDLMDQIEDLKDSSEEEKVLGDEDPRLKLLLEPATAKLKKASTVLDKAMLLLKAATALKEGVEKEIDRRVDEEVNKTCRYRENAYDVGREAGRKEVDKEYRNLVNDLLRKYRYICWWSTALFPFFVFFTTVQIIDLIRGWF